MNGAFEGEEGDEMSDEMSDLSEGERRRVVAARERDRQRAKRLSRRKEQLAKQ